MKRGFLPAETMAILIILLVVIGVALLIFLSVTEIAPGEISGFAYRIIDVGSSILPG